MGMSPLAPPASDAEFPLEVPIVAEAPPTNLDEVELPIVDSVLPSVFESEEEPSAVDARDALEGPPVESIVDDLGSEDGAIDDQQGLGETNFDAVDEVPESGGVGDDLDGLGDDASGLDVSLLTAEKGDDGADGAGTDQVLLTDPTEPLDDGEPDDATEVEPIELPPLPLLIP